jgi:hypothetical protein
MYQSILPTSFLIPVALEATGTSAHNIITRQMINSHYLNLTLMAQQGPLLVCKIAIPLSKVFSSLDLLMLSPCFHKI